MTAESYKAARDFLQAGGTGYERAYESFRWPALERFNWALDWFDRELATGATKDRAALEIVGEHAETTSFAALAERSNRLANGLRALGVRRGDPILVMLGNVTPLWTTVLAAMKLGAVVIPATTLLTSPDIADRFARGEVRHVVAAAAESGKFAGLGSRASRIAVGERVPGWHVYGDLLSADPAFEPDGPTAADDPMLLYFTSGTTAKPKLVLHSHRSYPLGHLSTMYVLGLRSGDRHLNVSSPGWAKHAWSCFFAPWIAGATIFIVNQPRFDARPLLDAIVAHEVTTICAPPTIWRMLVQEDLGKWQPSVRELASAGEPLNPEVIERVKAAWGLTIRDFYGQTETTALIGNPPGEPIKPGSMGRPLPGYRFRLIDVSGEDAEEGEICISLDPKPAGLMHGYRNDDGRDAPLSGDVYRTGDVAVRDADGYLTYVGRADDIFKASDYRISPFEIESLLIEHAAVAEAAVVPAPDPVRAAIPKAYLALAAGWAADRATALAIFRHVRARSAPYKRIRRLEFAELPKTISGKIRRVELRQAEAARAPDQRAPGEYREEDFSPAELAGG
ncbi:MAG: AMP-binding protein [Acetobacteraceae bacterium]